MKIAVPYEDGNVFQHFGKTEKFKVFDIVDNKISHSTLINTNGINHGALANLLADGNISILICGGIGEGAINALKEKNITIYGGINGNIDEAINDFLNNKLEFNDNYKCNHHQENNH